MRLNHLMILSAMTAIAACVAPPQAAIAQEAEAPRTITVSGRGEAAAAPDMAVLSIGVRTDAQTAAAALRQNSADMAATIAKLKDLDVADRDIQTSGLSINPRYDYGERRSDPRVIGFTATNTLTVKLRDLDRAGAVIDQAVQSGANSLGGVQLTFADPKPLSDAARKDAVADARGKAALYAEAAGVRLGRVLSIQDGYVATPAPQPYATAALRMESDAAVPMQAGESTITASVTIVYAIE
ncbi:MAG: SIMPL domain-containing protein [Hyphococcus sp.]